MKNIELLNKVCLSMGQYKSIFNTLAVDIKSEFGSGTKAHELYRILK